MAADLLTGPEARDAPPRGRTRALLRHLGTPIAIAVVLGVLYLWVHGLRLDSIERRTLNYPYMHARLIEHFKLTAAATVLVIVIAVPLGILVDGYEPKQVAHDWLKEQGLLG